MIENVLKKSSIVLASLALVVPLAMSSSQAPNIHASRVRVSRQSNKKLSKAQIRRDIRAMNDLKGQNEAVARKLSRLNYQMIPYFEQLDKKDILQAKKHIKRGHHYYKFAYNKKKYNWAMNRIKKNTKLYKRIANNLTKAAPNRLKNKYYKLGVFEAYGRLFSKKLAKNKSYRAGYIKGVRDVSGYAMTPKDAAGYYKDNIRHGVGMPNYVRHFKTLAHYNLN